MTPQPTPTCRLLGEARVDAQALVQQLGILGAGQPVDEGLGVVGGAGPGM